MHIAIEAMAALVNRIPDLRLTIVGNGPEEGRLKSRCRSEKVGGECRFYSLDAAG